MKIFDSKKTFIESLTARDIANNRKRAVKGVRCGGGDIPVFESVDDLIEDLQKLKVDHQDKHIQLELSEDGLGYVLFEKEDETDDEVVRRLWDEQHKKQERYKRYIELQKEFGTEVIQ